MFNLAPLDMEFGLNAIRQGGGVGPDDDFGGGAVTAAKTAGPGSMLLNRARFIEASIKIRVKRALFFYKGKGLDYLRFINKDRPIK